MAKPKWRINFLVISLIGILWGMGVPIEWGKAETLAKQESPAMIDPSHPHATAPDPIIDLPSGRAGMEVGSEDPGSPQQFEEDLLALKRMLSRTFQNNLKEMQIGEIAINRGTSQEVRELGDRIFRDHRMMNLRISDLMRENQWEMPSWLPQSKAELDSFYRDLSVVDRLQTVDSAEFDKVFLSTLVEGHERKLVDLHTVLKDLGENSKGDLLSDLVPIIGQHRDIALILKERAL